MSYVQFIVGCKGLNLSSVRKFDKLYTKELMRDLQDEGLSGALASRAINAVVRAMDAGQNLLDLCDVIKKMGKSKIAGRLWAEHVASLLAWVPREHRRQYVKGLLKLADEMEESDRKIEDL